jgi:hypothetical protein
MGESQTQSDALEKRKIFFPCQELNHNSLVGQPIAYLLHQPFFSEVGTVNVDVSWSFCVIEADAVFGLGVFSRP